MNFKPAIPVSYKYPETNVGQVYIGVKHTDAPLRVREANLHDWGTGPVNVIIEFEDLEKVAADKLGQEISEPIIRLCLRLPDAKILSRNLISRLAITGDQVSEGINRAMNESIDANNRQKAAATPALAQFNQYTEPGYGLHIGCYLHWPYNPETKELPYRNLNALQLKPASCSDPNPLLKLLCYLRDIAHNLNLSLHLADPKKLLAGSTFEIILENCLAKKPYNPHEATVLNTGETVHVV